jgi:uncharacterized protein
MAAAFTYPGVYIQEVSGVGSIVGVSTSDTAFMDFFPRGPVGVATRITSFDVFSRTFGGLDERSEASYAIQQFFLNGGAVAWVVRVVAGTASAASFTITSGSAGGPGLFVATAASVGTWGGVATAPVTQIQLGLDIQAGGGATYTTASGQFNLVVRLVTSQQGGAPVVVAQEVYRGVNNIPTSPRYAVTVVNAQSSLITLALASGLTPPLPVPFIPAPTGSGPQDAINNPSNSTFFSLVGGVDGDVPVLGDPTTAWATSTGALALTAAVTPGTSPLDRMAPFNFNLMCIPAAAELVESGMVAVYNAAAAYCVTRRAFLLVDIPRAGSTVVNYKDANTFMATWFTGVASQLTANNDHMAVYFPRLQLSDPLNTFQPRSVAASGTIAGIYARTDANKGVWKAPAGTDATLVSAAIDNAGGNTPPINITDADNGALNPFGINAIRNFPVFGTVVWGARTLAGADILVSQWKYVPVRRMALYIEESLFEGSKFIVFQPNDEPLWSEIRKVFGAFMQSLFLQGAFQGTTPSQAYFVRCDSSTTTQTDINNGVVNILVGFAPLKPAEFVVISIQQMAGQAAS